MTWIEWLRRWFDELTVLTVVNFGLILPLCATFNIRNKAWWVISQFNARIIQNNRTNITLIFFFLGIARIATLKVLDKIVAEITYHVSLLVLLHLSLHLPHSSSACRLLCASCMYFRRLSWSQAKEPIFNL